MGGCVSQMQILGVSCSYLIYDMVCCHFDKRVSVDNTIHHLISIVGIAAGLAYQKVNSFYSNKISSTIGIAVRVSMLS